MKRTKMSKMTIDIMKNILFIIKKVENIILNKITNIIHNKDYITLSIQKKNIKIINTNCKKKFLFIYFNKINEKIFKKNITKIFNKIINSFNQ